MKKIEISALAGMLIAILLSGFSFENTYEKTYVVMCYDFIY